MFRGRRTLTVASAIALFAVTLVPVAAQEEPASSHPVTDSSSPTATVITATRHDTSEPLREMVEPLTESPERAEPVEMPLLLPEQVQERATRRAQSTTEDPLRQKVPGEVATPDPIVNFEGQSDDDNEATPGAFRLAPPDTEGDVGPNHYVQMINVITEIYDKEGNSLLGPFANIDLFSGFGGACETENDGDPVALYDQFADRWMLSQFAIDEGIQCVAVSTTGDPTGSYHRYAFQVAPMFNDYPKMGVWPDGYYLTFNEFDANEDFLQAVACAFERDEMLQGNPAQQVCFGNPPIEGDTFFSLQPAHLEGMTPPPEGTPNPFIMAFDDEVWGGSPDPNQDFYKMWQFSVDWAAPANSTLTGPIDAPTEEFDAEFCNFSRNCIGQPGTASNLDVLGQFTMYRAVYRSFDDTHPDGAHEELWVNHSVDLNGDSLAGIRWTEIRSPATEPVLHQTGTWGPDDGENRWMGSLSVDDGGNMLLAYSLSSETTFPSIRYAGRLVTDPLGTLGQEENELWAGTGSQIGSGNRWGDYSTVSLDETDGCSFWITNEYYETTTSFDFKSRIGATRYLTCLSSEIGTIAGTVTDADVGGPLDDVTVTADDGAGGVFSSVTNDGGSYAISAPAGTYEVTAIASGYEPETETDVVVSDGSTTVVDFSLTEGPTADISPTSFTFETPLGDTTDDTLNIGNTGVAELEWSIAEADSAEGCGTPGDVPWLAASPESGTTAAGGTESVQVSVDTSTLEVGSFEATLCVNTDDSDAPLVPVTVALNVTPPATFGTLEGTVASASSCDPSFSAPVAGATVTATGQLGTHVTETDDSGFYQFSLDEGESPLTVEVTADGHIPGSAEGVTVTAGELTVEDFDLELDAPCADVSPDSITTSVELGQSEDHTLTIGNGGSQPLEWTIRLPEPSPADGGDPTSDEPDETAPSAEAERPEPGTEAPSPEDEDAGIDRSPRTAEPAEPGLTGAERIQQIQQGGVLLISQPTNDRFVALDPETGDVLDENFINYTDVGDLGVINHTLLHPDGERLLASSQSQDVVHSFDLEDGTYLGVFAPASGEDNDILDNIRGMAIHPDTGNLLVTSNSGGNADSVVEFDLDGNPLGQFIPSGAGGISSPWSLVFRDSDVLLSNGIGDGIYRFDREGTFLDIWNNEIQFPQQITEIDNENVLGAGFSTPNGVWEFDPDGNQVALYDVAGLNRGAHELPDGRILTTDSGGIHRFSRDDPSGSEELLDGSSYMITPIGVINCDIPEWLSVDPVSGSTEPGGSDTVTASIDTTGLPLGEHTAGICVDSNDPVQPTVSVPVTLNVELPPNIGTIQGTVQTLGYCDADVGALEGATVEIAGAENTETLETDEGGFYQAHLPDSESPLTITVTADGHLPATVEGVTFGGGDVVTEDFDLDLDAPCVTVDPTEFSFNLRENDVATETLTIGNVDGAADLDWSVAEAESIDEASPVSAASLLQQQEGVPAFTTTGFVDVGYVTMDATDPSELTTIVDPQPNDVYAATFIDNDFTRHYMLASSGGSLPEDTFGYIDTATGEFTTLGTVSGAPAGGIWSSMKWDHSTSTLYASNIVSSGDSRLFTIDPDTLEATEVGPIQGANVSTQVGVIAIAISADGLMYGIDIADDVLLAIDKTTGDATVIGDTGVSASFAQDMDFDHTDGTLYWAGYQGGGDSQIFTVDTETGAATSLGDVAGGSELLSFSVALPSATLQCDDPSDIAWLGAEPNAGTAAAGSSNEVGVTVDTSELTAGEYEAGLCVSTSDSVHPLIEVPVALTLRPEFVLEAEGRRVRGLHFVDLTWSGAQSDDVDISRDGELITTERNDGAHTDNTGQSGRATYVYQVCEAGTDDCSNEVTVSFGGPPQGRGGGGG